MKSKKPVVILPLVPLTFIVTYFGDLAYGPKMNRIRGNLHFTPDENIEFWD